MKLAKDVAAAYAREVLAGHMAWMRANVRCETCRFWTETMDCGNTSSLCQGRHMMGLDGCQHWEPKP